MQLRTHFSRILLAAVILASLAAMPLFACETLWIADHELWSADGDQARLVASDARGIDRPAWSPSRDRIAYAHDFRFDDAGAATEIAVVTRDGKLVRALPVDADLYVNAITAIGWRSEQRLYAIGHVNPSTSIYLEWDVARGRLVESVPGSAFAVSADGRSLAHRAHVPHGAPAPYDASTLIVDGDVVWPVESDHAYHRFIAGPTWSESGRIALLDRTEAVTELVIIDRGKHSVDRKTLDVAIQGGLLTWDGADSLELREGGTTWHIDADTGRGERGPRTPSTESVAPPEPLRQRVARIANTSRCRD